MFSGAQGDGLGLDPDGVPVRAQANPVAHELGILQAGQQGGAALLDVGLGVRTHVEVVVAVVSAPAQSDGVSVRDDVGVKVGHVARLDPRRPHLDHLPSTNTRKMNAATTLSNIATIAFGGAERNSIYATASAKDTLFDVRLILVGVEN